MNKDVKGVEVSFINEGSGWISLVIKVNGSTAEISISDVFPPFEEMLRFLESVVSGNLPTFFRINEEGDFKAFKAMSADNELVHIVLYDDLEPEIVFIDAVFDRKQLVSKFVTKLDSFIKAEWNSGRLSSEFKLRLGQLRFDRLKAALMYERF